MKKFALITILMFVVSAAAFAERPAGWGIGILAQHNLAWDGFGGNWGVGVSLKAPQWPIFWGINLDFRSNFFGIGLTGDYYLLEQVIVEDVNFGWFIGLGGYGSFASLSNSWTSLRLGGRVPVGVYIMPVDFLEVFLSVAPSLGLGLYFGEGRDSPFNFPEGGFGVDFGIRFWF